MLAGALFMLEVYDRVLPSRSVPTLVALLLLVAGLYGAQGLIDMIRSRILVRIGHGLDEAMSLRVYEAIVRLPAEIGNKGDGSQPIRDLDAVRSLSLRQWACRLLRSAVDAGLSRDLLPVSLPDRTYGAGWRHHPCRTDSGDRDKNPPSDPQRRPIRGGAQPAS